MRRWSRGALPSLHASASASSVLPIPSCLYSTPGKVKVRVKTPNGAICDVDAPVGMSLMHTLRDVAKLGVAGSCNGCMECGTCHVYLSEKSFEKAAAASEREEDLLAKSLDVRETSRLSCQVTLTKELEELEVELPSYLGDMW